VITVADRRSGAAVSAGILPGGWRALTTPVRILQLYVVLLVLIPPTEIIEPLGAAGTPATVLGLVALVQWAVAAVTPGEGLARTVVPVRVVLGLLVATFMLRYAVMHVGYVPVEALTGSDVYLLRIFSWAGVALLAAEGLQDRAEIKRVLRTLVAVVAVMAVIGFLQFRAGIDLTTYLRQIPGLHENADLITIQARGAFRRPSGTATHPIEFGCVIAMVLALALHLARFDTTRTRARRWLPVAMISIGIPVAVSRSAILGAVVAGVVIFLGLEPRLRPKALMSVAVFLTLIYATTPGLLGTLRGFFLSTGSDSRKDDYGPAFALIRKSVWFGHGPGSFINNSDLGNVLDNQYLGSLIEVGLIGLVVLLVYLLAAAFLGRGARHRSSDPATRDLGQALAAASISAAVTSYTFDSLSFRMFAGIIPLCLGIAGAVWVMIRVNDRSREDDGLPAVTAVQAFGAGAPITVAEVPDRDVTGDQAEQVAARTADVDLAPGTTVIDLSDSASGLNDPAPDEPLRLDGRPDRDLTGEKVHDGEGLDRPLEPDGRDGPHDLRRIYRLIGAGAAVIVLLGLPFFVDESDGGQVAQVDVPDVPEVALSDLPSTTILDSSAKTDGTQPQAQGGGSRTVATTPRRTATTVPSRSGSTSVSTRLQLGGGPTTSRTPTTTTTPPTATTAPPTPTTTAPPTPSTTTTTTASTTTTTASTTTTTASTTTTTEATTTTTTEATTTTTNPGTP
jgi:polysaccharide biosynthesis protein PslJ